MRAKLSYANVVGTLALLLAVIGGTAAALPGKNSVQSNDLKKNSVKARAIASNAVRAAEIKDGTIADNHVAPESLGYGKLGSNSVVARFRTTQPTATGDATFDNPVVVPVTGASWPQAANETQVFFGEARTSQPGTCTGGGGLIAALRISGIDEVFTEAFADFLDPDDPQPEPFLRSRPYLFETGAETQRTAEMIIWDSCTGADESLTLEQANVIVVGMR